MELVGWLVWLGWLVVWLVGLLVGWFGLVGWIGLVGWLASKCFDVSCC